MCFFYQKIPNFSNRRRSIPSNPPHRPRYIDTFLRSGTIQNIFFQPDIDQNSTATSRFVTSLYFFILLPFWRNNNALVSRYFDFPLESRLAREKLGDKSWPTASFLFHRLLIMAAITRRRLEAQRLDYWTRLWEPRNWHLSLNMAEIGKRKEDISLQTKWIIY